MRREGNWENLCPQELLLRPDLIFSDDSLCLYLIGRFRYVRNLGGKSDGIMLCLDCVVVIRQYTSIKTEKDKFY